MRIALAQINPTVGKLDANADLILANMKQAAGHNVHIALFPEMVITGYPVEDLALRHTFRIASKRAVDDLAARLSSQGLGHIVAVVGYLDESANKKPQNAAAVIYDGAVVARYIKHHLPNYGVFDEFRNFVPGTESLVIRVHGVDVGIAICEDIWRSQGPVSELAARTPGLVLVPNGSPFERSKDGLREKLVKERARQIGAPLIYVNMTGAQDDLVFDGDSIAATAQGEIIARAPQFDDGMMFVDLELSCGTSTPDVVISEEPVAPYQPLIPGSAHRLDDLAQVWNALVVGLRDYVTKNNFPSVITGVSGGIDSSVVMALAADAIGREKVYGVSLPSRYSSTHSLADAADLAARIGFHYRVIEIQPMVDTFLSQLGLTGIAEENVQARVRGTTLMGLSNQEGHLVLANGNKSELAVGYSTMYGDAVGGYAPIKDLLKSEVWALARWRNAVAASRGEVEPIPVNSIAKEPSAELRPGQKDTDSLPDYATLDRILHIYIEKDEGMAGLLAAGFNLELATKVVRMVDAAEYKRRQYPPGTKISSRAFGKDRRLPITSGWREEIL
ncbi:MAG: NAD+ synthase [Actinobacteria bacterium]|nr:NAD+ synthase [Actinomycetota bacterium]MSW98795.1 NAD+ synthase [Actinomycetota bacterium]MSY82708.1 NAD+ synthase [Actinomycetota bacterium]